ncbi:MAG: desulfoferrodoxin [Coriobacteriales bacterium]|nr:desulfoferrodoxin [Coriobacteriales bacterium]
MAEVKFYKCQHCGNIVMMVDDKGVNPVCCGEKMQLLVAGAVDASVEKHVPVIEKLDNGHLKVTVGAVAHPMAEEHYIEWIMLVTEDSRFMRLLKPGDEPQAFFGSAEHGVVYAYCNLHGLWKAEF